MDTDLSKIKGRLNGNKTRAHTKKNGGERLPSLPLRARLLLEAQALVDGQRLVPRRRRVLRGGLGHEAEALRLEQLVPQAPGKCMPLDGSYAL